MREIIIEPAEQRVIIKLEKFEEEVTAKGIIIPATAQEGHPETGIIVATGFGSIDNPMKYFKDQRVLFSEYAGVELKLNIAGYGEGRYKVMNQIDIMGIIKNWND